MMETSTSAKDTEPKQKPRSPVFQIPQKVKYGSKRDLLLDEYEDEWVQEKPKRSMSLDSDFSDTAIFVEFQRSLRQSLHDSLHMSEFYASSSELLDDSDHQESDEEDDEALVETPDHTTSYDNDDNFMISHCPTKPDPIVMSTCLSNKSSHTASKEDMNATMLLCDVFE